MTVSSFHLSRCASFFLADVRRSLHAHPSTTSLLTLRLLNRTPTEPTITALSRESVPYKKLFAHENVLVVGLASEPEFRRLAPLKYQRFDAVIFDRNKPSDRAR